jgi:hypothetical protein
MIRARVRWGALVAMVAMLSAACGGPVSIGQSLPVSGDSISAASIATCLGATGRIRVVVDSTAAGNPSYVKAVITDNAWAGGDMVIFPTVQGGSHFEQTSSFTLPSGKCVAINMTVLCIKFDDVCQQTWWNTGTRSFHYEVSLVP